MTVTQLTFIKLKGISQCYNSLWIDWKREKQSAPAMMQTLDYLAHSLVSKLTALSLLL